MKKIRSKTGKPTRLLIILIVASLIIVTTTAINFMDVPKPPFKEVAAARNCLAEAKRAKANIYALSVFKEAEENYQAALREWKIENEKWLFNRDFSRVISYANTSCDFSNEAIILANSSSIKLVETLKTGIEQLQNEVDEYQEIFSKLPNVKEDLESNSKGRLYLAEAKMAFKNSQYGVCKTKLEESGKFLLPTYQKARATLQDYFDSYNRWQLWAKETIHRSKNRKSSVLIVDKFARTCSLYKNGKLVKSFGIELGKNWIGDKNHKGDKATPEGLYMVTVKKDNGRTKYYKALLLNYPNEEDKMRFKGKKMNKEISNNLEIGGAIEIHGEGGKGMDWTDGCIALTNVDMDELFRYCNTGTEVMIVGSLRPLDEVINHIHKES